MTSNTQFGSISVNAVRVSVNNQNPQKVRNVGFIPPTDYLIPAFNAANAAYATANAGYATANAGYLHANSAYAKANLAYSTAELKLPLVGGEITGDLTISGNLNVEGVSFKANTNLVVLEDNIITLSSGVTGSPTANGGIEINRGNQPNVALIWSEQDKAWEITNDGTTYEKLGNGNFANAAYATANASYATGNAAYAHANSAYESANNVFPQIAPAFAQANAAYAHANSGFNQANAAYAAANAGISYSNAIFNYANTLVRKSGDTMTGNLALSITTPGNALTVANTDGLTYVLDNNGNQTVYGYANVFSRLTVGTGSFTLLPNLIAQFTGNSSTYSQVSQQNLDGEGSGDFVITSDNGTDLSFYTDMGKAGSTYSYYGPDGIIKPNDSYLIAQGNDGHIEGSNLHIIATTASGGDITFSQGGAYVENEVARFVYGQGLVIKHNTPSTDNASGTLVVEGGIGANGAIRGDALYDLGIRVKDVAQSGHDTANLAYQTGYYANTAWNQANSAYATVNALAISSNSVNDTSNTNLKLYTDGKISTNVATINSSITANAASANSVINTRISANVATLRGEITANAVSANSVINTNISANVATLRGEITGNVNTINSSITANAVSANSVINTNISANVATLRGEITANAASANSVINTRVSANVATLRGEITTNAASTNTYTHSLMTANAASTNAYTNNIVSANLATIRGEVTSNVSTINTSIAANLATIRGEVTSNVGVINTSISANVATLRGEITGNVATINSSITANAASANSVINTRISANVATLRGEITGNVAILRGEITANAVSANSVIATNVATLRGEITANAASANSVINTNISANVATLRGEITANAASANSVLNTNISANVATLRSEITANAASANSVINTRVSANVATLRGEITSNVTTINSSIAANITSVFSQSNAAYATANAAFTKANNALANTSSTLAGSLTVTGNVTVGTYIDSNTSASNPTQVEGRLFYDNTQKALSYYNDTNMTLQIGQESVVRVWNNTASVITDGKVVYIEGASSANGFPSIKLAIANSAITAEAIGITTTSIPVGGYGFVTQQGKINGLDTSTYVAGTDLFLSATVPGGFTSTIPSPPNIPLNVGYVARSDVTNGSVLVGIHPMEGRNKSNGAIIFGRNGSLDQDPNDLFWDYANNSLGINTNTPQANLHVVGSTLLSGNVTITGNLAISNAQAITTSELTVGGNTIILNSGASGVPTTNAIIIVNRGSSQNTYINWDESIDEWTMYDGSGNVGHILHSEKTAKTWADYTAMAAYEKLTHPIGANLSNSINEFARSAYATANGAVATGFYANTAWNQANAAYAQGNTTITNTNSYITANAASANSVINSRITSNVAILNANIDANVSVLYGSLAANVLTVNASISENVWAIRDEISANSVSDRQYTDSRISANVATLRGEITSNISTANIFTQAAFNKANTVLSNWAPNIVLVANSTGSVSNSSINYYATNNQIFIPTGGALSIGTTANSSAIQTGKTFTTATGGEQFGNYLSTNFSIADTGLKQGIRLNTSSTHTSNNLNALFGALNLVTAAGIGGRTINAYGIWSRMDVSSGAYLDDARAFYAEESGGASYANTHYGYYVTNLQKSPQNFGFYGAVNKGANTSYNLYMAGNAPNYLAGDLRIANTTVSTSNATGALLVTGGVGVTGNVYVGLGSAIGYSNATSQSVVFQSYNAVTDSLDTYFG